MFFICAFYGKESTLSPMSTFICACFAKSSVMWIPMLYISTSTHFQISFVNHSNLNKQAATSAVEPPAATSVPAAKNPPAIAAHDGDFTPIGE